LNEAIFGCIGALVVVVIMVLIFPIISALFGAFSGWVVGIFFSSQIGAVLAHFGLNYPLWQIGMTLGFVSGFFRSSPTQSNDKKQN
jgi:hypothetical protein